MRKSRSVPDGVQRLRGLGASAALALLVLVPASAAAQDFLFGPPVAWFRVSGGLNFATASSDVFDEWMDRLTLNRSDFRAPSLGADVGVRVTDRLDVVGGVRYSSVSEPSEYRHFVDQDDLPIVQETKLSTAPVTVGLRWNAVPAGREISSFAWIPAPFVPYLGAAVGMVWYQFRQRGDFIVESDPELPVVTDDLISTGWGKTAHAFAGADFVFGNRFMLNLEARYAYGSSDLDPFTYGGYDPIDLSGFWTSFGLAVKF